MTNGEAVVRKIRALTLIALEQKRNLKWFIVSPHDYGRLMSILHKEKNRSRWLDPDDPIIDTPSVLFVAGTNVYASELVMDGEIACVSVYKVEGYK